MSNYKPLNDCPPAELLREFSEHQGKATDFFTILQHIERCETCRSKIILPSPNILLETLNLGKMPPPLTTNKSLLESLKGKISKLILILKTKIGKTDKKDL